MKKIINLLLIILVFSLSIGIIGCGGLPPVQLKDFENKTETVNCGDYYTLPSAVVFDENDEFYRVTYGVKDKQGKEVSVSANKFLAKELGNGAYVITCSTVVGEKTYTRKITINVEDNSAPEILSTSIKCAAVNTAYSLDKNIEVKDNSGSYSLTYQVKDSEQNPIQIGENNTLTIASEGNYIVTVTATDSANNSVSKDFTLQVRGENVVQDFKYASDMALTQTSGFTATWLETYEGANGVAKITSNNAYGYFSIKALCDLDTYSDCSHIVVRYFIPSTSTVTGSFFFGESGQSAFAPVVGKWATTVISYELFNAGWSKGTIYSTAIAGTLNGEMYIDSVIGISSTKATGSEYAPIRTVADVDFIDTYYSNKAYVDDYQGATGVVAITLTGGNWGGFVIKPQQEASVYAGADYVVVRMYAEQAVTSIWFNNGGSDTQAPLLAKSITAGSWVEYLIKADDIDFTKNVRLSFNSTGKVYIDEAYVTETVELSNGGVIEDFAESTSTASFVGATATEYLAEYQGKQGVVKVTVGTDTNQNVYKFKSTSISYTEIVASEWDYLEVVFYAPISKWLYSNNAQLDVKNTANGWYTMQVAREKITNLTAFATNLTGEGVQLLMVYADSTPLTEVYFDSVKLVKNS